MNDEGPAAEAPDDAFDAEAEDRIRRGHLRPDFRVFLGVVPPVAFLAGNYLWSTQVAIIVAFVGRLHPLGVALASLLMSLLYLGGESAQVNLALPSAVTGLFQGTLLFLLLAADVLVDYRVRVVQRAAAA